VIDHSEILEAKWVPIQQYIEMTRSEMNRIVARNVLRALEAGDVTLADITESELPSMVQKDKTFKLYMRPVRT